MVMIRRGCLSISVLVLLILLVSVSIPIAQGEDKVIEIVSFTEGGLVQGDWVFNVTVTGNVSEVTMTIDDGATIALVEAIPGNYSIKLNTSSFADGVHEVLVKAVDDGGISDEATLSLDIDNTPPLIEVGWPADTIITYPFNVGVNFNDVHSDGARAWVELIDNKNLTFPLTFSELGFNGIVDIHLLDEGIHAFWVVAVDGVGNCATSEIKTLQIEKLADLAIKYFQITGGEPSYVGDRKGVYFEIRNIGYEKAGLFSVDLLVNGEPHDSLVFSEGLAVNKTLAGVFNWSSDESGGYTLGIMVDPDNEIEELNVENNQDEGSFDYNQGTSCSVLGVVIPILLIQIFISPKRDYSEKEQQVH